MAKEQLNYLPIDIARITGSRDCKLMADATFGRYMRLLIRQWVEGEVPADPKLAIKDAGLDHDAEGDVLSLLDRKFGPEGCTRGCRRNSVLEEVRADVLRRVEANRTNGRLGGRPRNQRDNPPETDGFSLGEPSPFSSSSSSSSSSAGGESERGRQSVFSRWLSTVMRLLPAEFQTAEFQREWCKYEESRQHHLTQPWAEESARELAAMGVTAAVDAMRKSMANGWKGLGRPDKPKPKRVYLNAEGSNGEHG